MQVQKRQKTGGGYASEYKDQYGAGGKNHATSKRILMRPTSETDIAVGATQSGQKVSFVMDHTGDAFLQCSSVFLVGELKIGTTGTYATDKASICDVKQILDRFTFNIGGTSIIEQKNCDVNILHSNLSGSGYVRGAAGADFALVDPLQMPDYKYVPDGQAVFQTGNTANTVYKFRIRLQYKPTELFGPAEGFRSKQIDTNVMLPLSLLPKAVLDIYFRPAHRCVSGATSTATSTYSYTLSNLRLDTQHVFLPHLLNKIKSQGGCSHLFEHHLHVSLGIAGAITAGTTITDNIQVSRTSVNHLMGRIRADADLTDVQLPNRNIFSDDLGYTALNCWKSNQRVYTEDLDSQGLLRQVQLAHPEAKTSSFTNSTAFHDGPRCTYLVRVANDFFDPSMPTGDNAAKKNTGYQVVHTFDANTTAGSTIDTWVSHNRSFTYNLNGYVAVYA